MRNNYVNGVYTDLNQRGAPENELVFDLDSVYQSIDNILQTERGERFFRPDFGADLGRLLFEVNDTATESMVEKIVVDAIERWDDRLQVDYGRTSVTRLPDDNTLQLSLAFTVQGLPQQTIMYKGVIRN